MFPKSFNESKRKYPKGFDSNSRLFTIWRCIKYRCYDTTHPAYHRYSAKGIVMCDEWLNSYKSFCDWALSSGYDDTLQIDRIDNDGIYCPDNCRWVTSKKNCNNKINNVYIEAFGERKTFSEWADDERCVVDYHKLWNRYKNGIDFVVALQTKRLYRPKGFKMSEAQKKDLSDKAKLRAPPSSATREIWREQSKARVRDESGRFVGVSDG